MSVTEELDAVELGDMLRETRSTFQRELSDVASELRIRLVYLEAIEEGRLDRLPGPAYASGFLRAYGDYLGLDGEDLVSKFNLAGGVGEGRMDLQLPSPVEEGRLPTGSILLVAAVLAFVAYGGWYYLSSQGRDPMKFVASLPEHLMALVGGESGDQPEMKPVAVSDPVEKAISAADTPGADHPEEPRQTNEEPNHVSDSRRPAAADAVSPLNKDDTSETRIVKTVEAVTSASAAPAPPVTSTEKQPQIAELPPSGAPTVPVNPQNSRPASAILAAPESSGANEKTELANSSDNAPQVREMPPLRPEAVAPVKPETPAVSTPQPEALPNPPLTDGNGVLETATSQSPAPKEVVNSPPTQQTEEFSNAPVSQDVNSNKVLVRATADSWVEVRSGDQDPMLSKVLHAGDVYEVPSLPGLRLATGNAGGIEVVVNGRALPLLGPMGAVRRDVALDAESLLARASQVR